MKGKFITFEGSEGSGKSTQINLIHKYLKEKKQSVLFLREPGGVKISEKIRDILLDTKNKEMGEACETLLYMAARAQLVKEVVMPAMEKGRVVLCDRFLDSTVVYQGYGCGVDIKLIKQIGAFATQGLQPDLTIVFDIDAAEGLSRIHRKKDRIEQRDIQYHEKVRAGYLDLAKTEPERIKVVKVDRSKEDIHGEVKGLVDKVLGL